MHEIACAVQANFSADITRNKYIDDPKLNAMYRAPQALLMKARGKDCFDCEYYMAENPDLPREWPSTPPCSKAFQHFVNVGQFELRLARFTCDFDALALFPVTAVHRTGS